MATKVVTFNFLGLQHGLWCHDCLLPSAVVLWYSLGGNFPAPRSAYQCRDCGGRNVDPDPEAEWA